MNNTFSNFIAFVAGAAIGSFVTYKVIKARCDQIIQEEVDSVKDYYRNERGRETVDETIDEPEVDSESDSNEQDVKDYSTVLKNCKYGAESVGGPHIITPDEYGENDDYETCTLTYYADGVLVDDVTDEPIESVEDVVGVDSLELFGEYDDHSVFVRNDKFKCDYEILLDDRRYSETKSANYSHDSGG